MQCKFSPLCNFNAQPNGYCLGHASFGATIKKRPYQIPKRSAKRVKEDVIYAKIRKEKEAVEGSICQIRSPVCTGKVQGMHHVQKSSPNNRLRLDNLILACNACNLEIERNPELAKRFTISRFATSPTPTTP